MAAELTSSGIRIAFRDGRDSKQGRALLHSVVIAWLDAPEVDWSISDLPSGTTYVYETTPDGRWMTARYAVDGRAWNRWA